MTEPATVRDIYRWRLTWVDPQGTEHTWSDWCVSPEEARASLARGFQRVADLQATLGAGADWSARLADHDQAAARTDERLHQLQSKVDRLTE